MEVPEVKEIEKGGGKNTQITNFEKLPKFIEKY